VSEVAFGLFDIFQVDPALPTGESWRSHLEHARLADALGLEFIFLAERHFMPLYRAATPGLLLANLAATTTHARLGVMAWTLALHHPVLLAEEISALDHLSGGRLEVGVGLGHRPQEISGLGLPAEHRQAIFLEALMMLRQLWQGKPYTYDGAMYHVKDVLVDPPLQRPHPPFWYAGNDPATAAWAKRLGLNLAIGFQPDAALRAPAEAFVGGAGRLAVMRNIYVAESDAAAREEIVADLMRVGEELAANPRGFAAAPAAPLTHADAERQQADLLAKQVVVAGGPETVAAEIAGTLSTLGANVFLANIHLSGVDDARLRGTLTRFAEDVIPRVRATMARG
jgi:alkanesulfonate monooxygenase SsuD/methylene tetrahydromethanopterin reductase-like flavin-dependent oxidoreductase (luciferase family)